MRHAKHGAIEFGFERLLERGYITAWDKYTAQVGTTGDTRTRWLVKHGDGLQGIQSTFTTAEARAFLDGALVVMGKDSRDASLRSGAAARERAGAGM